MNRRQWFRSFVGETLAWTAAFSGTPQLRLSDLSQLPPQCFGALIPAVNEGIEIDLEGAFTVARSAGNSTCIRLFALDSPEQIAFSHFNGTRTVHKIAQSIGQDLEWDPGSSYAFVRNLFLGLVNAGVCVPANAVGRSLDGSICGEAVTPQDQPRPEPGHNGPGSRAASANS
jgi:hypothetical protein